MQATYGSIYLEIRFSHILMRWSQQYKRHVDSWGPFLESPEKPFVKLRPAYSVKLVFSYVVKGIKIKITANLRASRRLRFEDTKRVMAPEIRPKRFGTFEKQAHFSKVSKRFRWQFSLYPQNEGVSRHETTKLF